MWSKSIDSASDLIFAINSSYKVAGSLFPFLAINNKHFSLSSFRYTFWVKAYAASSSPTDKRASISESYNSFFSISREALLLTANLKWAATTSLRSRHASKPYSHCSLKAACDFLSIKNCWTLSDVK